ncbi:MAG: tetratricopeptide repeat protein [Reyranellales bacterium]
MKVPTLLLFVALSVIAGAGSALAGPYEQAKAAYDRGDDVAAFQLWRPLADGGDANAQFWLGAMYDLGRGVKQDYGAASAWYRRSAEQGNPNAQHNLAHMYEMGNGLPADYALAAAVAWYRRAAEQGYAAAQLNLGVLYTKGRGVRRDYIQAYKWFALAGAIRNRRFVAALMTPQDIAEADQLVRQWKAKPER